MRKYLLSILFLSFTCSLLALEPTPAAWNWWPLAIDFKEKLCQQADTTATDTLHYDVELLGVSSTGEYAPFFLQTNRNGNIAPSPHSINLSAGVNKAATHPYRWLDYDFAVQMTNRIAFTAHGSPLTAHSSSLTAYFNQLYAHARLLFVDITAGITPYHIGTQNDDLTSGGLLFSQNAHPLPRISIGIDQYTPVPGLFGYLEVRGGLTHAWFADDVYVEKAFLHHAYAGARVGGRLPVNISYEFHHAAQWGGYSPVYGDLGNSFEAFLNAVLARSGGSMANDQINAQGNHIGSQILTLEVKHEGWHARAYWQNVFEDGPILFMTDAMNLPDGLWGINLTQDQWPFISGLTYEFLNTTDQSGPYHDRDGFVYGGYDGYFGNSIYRNGWNYALRTIGNPYITSPLYNTNGFLQTENNRVMMHFVGVQGDIYGYRYRLQASHAKNYGLYVAPLETTNTALLLEVNKHVPQAWGLDFAVSLAADLGSQFGNSFGLLLSIRKQGIITAW